MHWFVRCLGHYIDGSGRACRREYWLYLLVAGLILLASFGVLILLSPEEGSILLRLLFLLLFIFLLIPRFAVTVRRLHDTGHRGLLAFAPAVCYLLTFVMVGVAQPIGVVVGAVLLVVASVRLLVLMVKPGDRQANTYGPAPRG